MIPKNSPCSTAKETSRSASFRSYVTRRNGWRKRSLNIVWRSCGIWKVFETPLTSKAGTSHPLGNARRIPLEDIEAERERRERDSDRKQMPAGSAEHAARSLDRVARPEERRTDVLDHLHERVQEDDGLRPRGQERDRVHHRRGEEQELDAEL